MAGCAAQGSRRTAGGIAGRAEASASRAGSRTGGPRRGSAGARRTERRSRRTTTMTMKTRTRKTQPPRKERPVYEPRPQREQPARGTARAGAATGTRIPKERPVYTPRNAGSAGGGRGFNLGRGAQGHRGARAIAAQRTRRGADQIAAAGGGSVRGAPEKLGAIIEGEPTPDELARLNLQLEARNAELQARIEDLMQHSEDVATSVGAMSGEPVSDTGSAAADPARLQAARSFRGLSRTRTGVQRPRGAAALSGDHARGVRDSARGADPARSRSGDDGVAPQLRRGARRFVAARVPCRNVAPIDPGNVNASQHRATAHRIRPTLCPKTKNPGLSRDQGF